MIQDTNYYIVQGWMINELQLKGNELTTYAIIYGFSQDEESEYNGSLRYLQELNGGISKPTIIKTLNSLIDKGYITKTTTNKNGIKFCSYKALQVVKKFNHSGKEILLGGGKETLPNKEYINKQDNNEDIYIKVISYLNERAGTNYKYKSQDTQKHINARLKDGFTADEMLQVIDKKCGEWLGTEWEKFLRPKTLFGNKFEDYLNQTIRKGKSKQLDVKPTFDIDAIEQRMMHQTHIDL